jgi:hypothetical protein
MCYTSTSDLDGIRRYCSYSYSNGTGAYVPFTGSSTIITVNPGTYNYFVKMLMTVLLLNRMTLK